MKGITKRRNGAFFQAGRPMGAVGIQGIGYDKISLVQTIKEESAENAGKSIAGLWEKLPALSKKDKANGLKNRAGSKKRKLCLSEKKFPQVFVENKGLEEICRLAFTGVLDF